MKLCNRFCTVLTQLRGFKLQYIAVSVRIDAEASAIYKEDIMKKRIFAILMAISVILSLNTLTITCFAENMIKSNEDEAVLQYSVLMDSFTKTREGMPSYYAGAYVDDYGKLVVCVTDNSKSVCDDLKDLIGISKTKIVKKANSYIELNNLKNKIWDKYIDFINEKTSSNEINFICDAFVGIGIDQETNRVVVSLKYNDEKTIGLFKRYFDDSELINFDHVDEEETKSSDVSDKADAQIDAASVASLQSVGFFSGDVIRKGNATGSVGFRARMLITENGVSRYAKGFFTSGHVFYNIDLNDPRVDYLEATEDDVLPIYVYNLCGNVVALNIGGKADAAFIEINDSYDMIAQTRTGMLLGDNYYTSLPQGAEVNMCGSKTETSGEIKNTSYNLTVKREGDSTVTYTDTYRCDYHAEDGDSGGVVYREINGSNCIVGIHSGRLGFLSGLDSYVTKATNIYSTWNLYQY